MRKTAILCLLFLAAPFAASAQGTTNDLETDFGGRMSVTLDKKLAKGWHVTATGEARFEDNMSGFGRYQAELGMSYKINRTFKVGLGYTLIQKKNSSDVWKTRHRLSVSGQASFRSGDWRFSLKETLRYTHRANSGNYQNTPNSLSLKSRFKVAYKASRSITPYGYVELRNVFNDPAFNAIWSTTDEAYCTYDGSFSFKGYTDSYFNRVRTAFGVEFELSKKHSIDVFVMGDYCYDKNIDTKKNGTRLNSLTYDQTLNFGLGVAYTISF